MPKLSVRAADETTEIFVIAADFALRGRGARRLDQDLQAGIYKVRAVSGRSEWQRVIVLREDTTLNVPKIEFGSAAPLASTNRTHETHMYAAEQATPPEQGIVDAAPAIALSLGRRRAPVHSGSFVFMARWWTPWSDFGPMNLDNPAEGASLRTGGGRGLLPLDLSTEEGDQTGPTHAGPRIAPEATWFSGDLSSDRFSGASLNAAPGMYSLSLSDGESKIEQMITILPGWRTHVFALYEPPIENIEGTVTNVNKRLVDISIHISRDRMFMGDEMARLTDAARLALADERSTATNELLRYVGGKFENPMLGLYGAHLLLLLKGKNSAASIPRPVDYDDSLYREVVENTARIFGDRHPDIVALRGLGKRMNTIKFPPMLSHSWLKLLASSVEHPNLIPPSLWRRTALRSRTQPFFAWRIPQYGGDRIMQREIELTRAILEAAEEREHYDEAAAGLRSGRADASVREAFVRECVTLFEAPRSVIDLILR